MEETILRRCIKCNEDKSEDQYPPSYPNGHKRNECLKCCNERTKKWQAQNRDKVNKMARETRRRWNEKNSVLIEEVKKTYPKLTYKERMEIVRQIIRNNNQNKNDRRLKTKIISFQVKQKPETYNDYYNVVFKLFEKIDSDFDLPFVDVRVCFDDELTVKECFEIMLEKYYPNDKIILSN